VSDQESRWSQIFSDLKNTPGDIKKRIHKHLVQRKKLFQVVERNFGNNLEDLTILEVACGTGIECLLFSLRGAYCVGLDYEPKVLQYAQSSKRIFSDKIRFDLLRADGFKIPAGDQKFNFVLSQGFLEHFPPQQTEVLLREQVRVLKPGGILIADVPNLYSAYEMYKKIYTLTGSWFYGIERGVSEAEICKAGAKLGLKHLETYRWSFLGYPYRNIFDLMYMMPLLAIRTVWQLFGQGHDSVGVVLQKPPQA